MTVNTMLFEDLRKLSGRAYLDAAGKTLLGYRMICAFILKHCINSLKDYSIDYIAEKCIIGEPVVARKNVHANSSAKQELPEKIKLRNSEDTDADEGTVYYDVIFDILIPGETGTVKMIINLEAQNAFNPGYPLVTRGIYYDARMISSQYGTEFSNSGYGDIKKVYSVWVCINPDVRHRNTINRYHITEKNIFGNVKSPLDDYDKMEVIIIGLNCDDTVKSENELIEMLSVLFSKSKSVSVKRQRLENDYGIKMTKEYDEVVDNMCNISGYYTQDYDDAIARLTKAESDLEKAESDLAEITDRAEKAEGRADKAESELAKTTDRAEKAEGRADKAESELARYKSLYGDISDKV